MVRERYQRRIDNLRDDLLYLGNMVEQALIRAMRSLEHWNTVVAAQVSHDDQQIDEIWHVVEERTVQLLATEQPIVAGDLRLMTAIIAVAGELERIGDYAKSIARRVKRMMEYPDRIALPPELFAMATHVRNMLHTSLDSLLKQDIDLARSLSEQAQQSRVYRERLRDELVDVARNNPESIEAVLALIEIVHALDRVSDRSTNIGERVIYFVTSTIEELN
jgi:phosphate transport system protein